MVSLKDIFDFISVGIPVSGRGILFNHDLAAKSLSYDLFRSRNRVARTADNVL